MKKFKIILFSINTIISILWMFYLLVYPKINIKKDVTLPDLKNETKQEATNQLDLLHLNYEIIYVDSDCEEIIIETFPKENSVLKEGTTITLYVARLVHETMQDFMNLDYELSKEEIEDFCLNHQIELIVNYVHSENAGRILSQFPKGGEDLTEKLVLEVGFTYLKLEFPDFVGKNVSEAISYAEKYQLNFNYVFEESIYPPFTILFQGKEPGSELYEQSTEEITFIVSK